LGSSVRVSNIVRSLLLAAGSVAGF
jgi:hypothetical protein